MRLGLYFPLQLPRPWSEGDERRLFAEGLDQVELADRIGIDYAWVPEQHFTEEYSHSSAPEVFLAAASQRTSRIRLGHGVVLMPPAYNEPVRVAERTAALDLISNGRVEFGVGDSKSRLELEGFGIDAADRQRQTRAALEEVVRMWVESPYGGVEGPDVRVPVRNVLPKPLQLPHPPLWMACSDDEAVRRAARLGLGVLTHSFYDADEAARTVRLYHETFASECIPLTATVNPRIAMLNPFYCHRDPEVARDRGLEAAGFVGFAVRHYYSFGRHQPGRTDLWGQYQRVRAEFGGQVPLRGTHAIGRPQDVLEHLRTFAEVGIDQTILAHQGGMLSHDHIVESLRLLASDVLPLLGELRDRAKQRQRALQPVVDAALARRAARIEADAPAPALPAGKSGRDGVEAYGRSRPAPDPELLPPSIRQQVEDLERMAAVARSFED